MANAPEKSDGTSLTFQHPNNIPGRAFMWCPPGIFTFDGMEISEKSPIGFVKTIPVKGSPFRGNKLRYVSHKNFLSFKEVFVTKSKVFFIYTESGITLHDLQHNLKGLQFSELEVATICKEVRMP